MAAEILRAKIEKLKDSLEQGSKQGIGAPENKASAKSFHSFKENRVLYYKSSVEGSYNDLKNSIFDVVQLAKNQEPVIDMLVLWKELQKNKGDIKKSKEILGQMSALSSKISLPQKTAQQMSLKIPSMPDEIKAEVSADIREIEKCFSNSLYRSAVILCGRVLETALHRKYYEATGNDALEKSPGIGLGNLIAKMKEKNIEIDPALTQQIHLINQVRIFSVHKKKEAFIPTREQTHAIILYTIDAVGKMF